MRGYFGVGVDVYDPRVDAAEARHEYGIDLIDAPAAGAYDGIMLAVSHSEFVGMGSDSIRSFGNAQHVLYDLKCALPADSVDIRL